MKASKLAMTVEIVPEVSGDRENLLKRIGELVKKEVKFDTETKNRTIQEVIQRMYEKGLFKEKTFGAKLKDDIIKNLMVRQSTTDHHVTKPKSEGIKSNGAEDKFGEILKTCSMMETTVCTAINASDRKIGSILKASNSSGDKLDIIVDKASSSDAKIDQVLKTCKEILESVSRVHARMDKHTSECIAVDETLKLLQRIANRMNPVEDEERTQTQRFMCSYCEVDDHKLTDCNTKQRCLKCGLFSHKQESCDFDKTCNHCGVKGHAARLHDVVTQDERLKIITFHGPEAFGHFMAADQQQGVVGNQNRGGFQGRRGRGRNLGYVRFGRAKKF